MNLKRLVTIIVTGFALCFAFSLSCEAATMSATTTDKTESNYTEKELRYMTSIIYSEARGEGYAGQKAVGIVIMNRVRSNKFPNSVKKVIYQKGQFSPVRNGSLAKSLRLYDKQMKAGKMDDTMGSCMDAAKSALNGSTTITVKGKEKEMKKYLFFSRHIPNAKYTLGAHQFK